jgi:hypothetical protein
MYMCLIFFQKISFIFDEAIGGVEALIFLKQVF